MTLSQPTALLSTLFFTMLLSSATDLPNTKIGREIAPRTQFSIEQKSEQIIQTEEQWRTWWSKHKNTQDNPKKAETQKPPKIDFTKETVLIATMGMRSTGGHTIRFTDLRSEGETLKAVITTSSPAPNAMVTMALTYPFTIIAIPKHNGPIEFVISK